MISRIYFSKEKALFLAIEDILRQFYEDYFIEDFDFVVFAIHPNYPYEDVSFTIKSLLKSDKFIAFNSLNSFANQYVVAGVSALFIKFEKKGKIKVFSKEDLSDKEELQRYLSFNKNNLNIMFATLNEDLPYIVTNLEEGNLIGGIVSGEIGEEEKAFVYTPDTIIKNGFVIITFENVEFATDVSLGYKLIGPKYRINLSKKNRVYVIDFEDASLIAQSLLKGMENKNIKDLWYAPIAIIDKNNQISYVRTFKYIKEGEFVEFFGPIPQGSDVKLSFAMDSMLLEEDRRVALNVKDKLANIELAFNFSCVAREYILGDVKSKESESYTNILNSPLFGFFTYGEIAFREKIEFHNQTSVLVVLKEKDG